MKYEIIYDAVEMGFYGWKIYVTALGGFIIFRFCKFILTDYDGSDWSLYLEMKMLAAVLVAAAAFASIRHSQNLNILESPRHIAEGQTENLLASGSKRNPKYNFCVSQTCFEDIPAYQLPWRDKLFIGTYLRISHVGNTVVTLELLSDQPERD